MPNSPLNSSLNSEDISFTRYGNNISVSYHPSVAPGEEFGFHITETESYSLPSPSDGDQKGHLHDPTVENMFKDAEALRVDSFVIAGSVCILLGPTSRLRKGSMRFIMHESTRTFILVLCVLNCVFLSTANPSAPHSTYYAFTRTIEKVSIALYCLELMLHIIARGTIESPSSFFRYSLFNVIDGSLVLYSALGYAIDEESLKHLHAGRAFRCFLVFQRRWDLFGNNKVVMETIKHSVTNLIRAAVFLVFFFLVFAIMGVESFKGSYSRQCVMNLTGLPVVPPLSCKDKASALISAGCPPRMECRITQKLHDNIINFDNVGTGMIVLINIATFNNWGDLLYPLMEAENRFLPTIYFFAFIVTIPFIVMNFFTAVLTSRYFAVKGYYKSMAAKNPSVKILVPDLVETGPIRRPLAIPEWSQKSNGAFELWRLLSRKPIPALHASAHSLYRSKWFRTTVHISILLNVLLQSVFGLDVARESSLQDRSFQVDLCFLILLCAEVIIKIVGAGRDANIFGIARFVHNYWNVLDLLLIGLSTATMAAYGQGWTFIRLVRVLRFLRVLDYTGPQRLLNSILSAAGPLLLLSLFFVLSICIVAAIAIPVFATPWSPEYDLKSVPIRENFDTYGGAIMTLFTMIAHGNWTLPMYYASSLYPVFSPVFFLLVFASFSLVLMNIFTAIVLEYLELSEATQAARREEFVFGAMREHFYPKLLPCSPSETWASWMSTLENVWHKIVDVLHNDDDEGEADIEKADESAASSRRGTIYQEENNISRKIPSKVTFDSLFSSVRGHGPKVTIQQQEEAYIAHLCAERDVRFLEDLPDTEVLPEGMPPWVVNDTSLYIFSEQNWFRQLCIRVVTTYKTSFHTVMSVVILASCVTLALDPPLEAFKAKEDAITNDASWIHSYADLLFLAIFFVEAAIKIVANGFIYGIETGHRIPYFRDLWNRLDFALVGIMMVSTIFPNIRSARLLRAFRPFKLVRRYEKFRIVFSATARSVGGVFHVLMFVLFFVYVFGVVGLKLFGARLAYCNDGRVAGKAGCLGLDFNTESNGLLRPQVWRNPRSHFDSLPEAMLSVFHITLLSEWTQILYSVTDITGMDTQPSRSASSYFAVYFILVIIVQSFFLFNVFVGVLLLCFDEERGLLALTAYQQEWLQIRQQCNAAAPFRVRWYFYPSLYGPNMSTLHRQASNIVLHRWFEMSSTFIVLCNVATMSSVHAGQPQYWSDFILSVDTFFLLYYMAEATIKIFVMRPQPYFEDSWNKFDVTVVMGSVVVLIVESIVRNSQDVTVLAIKMLSRFFRTLRVLKLAKSNIGNLQFLFSTLVQSLPSILSVCVLLIVVLFISSLFATNLFGNVRFHSAINGRSNFRTVDQAVLTLMRLLTGDGLRPTMEDVMLTHPYCTATPELNDCGQVSSAIVFFICYGIMGSMVFLPIVMAIVIDNFNVCYNQFAYTITLADLGLFRREFERIVAAARIDTTVVTHAQLETLCCVLHAKASPLVKDVHPYVRKFNYRRVLFDLKTIGPAATWNGLKCTEGGQGELTFENVLAVLVTNQGGAESFDDPIRRSQRRRYERNRDEAIAHTIMACAIRKWLRHDVWQRDPKLATAHNTHKAHVWRNIDLWCTYTLQVVRDSACHQVVSQIRPTAHPVNPILEVFGNGADTELVDMGETCRENKKQQANVRAYNNDDDDVDSSTSTATQD